MAEKKILDIEWYRDETSIKNDEPGIVHSFAASLATCLNHISTDFDPIRFMGSSAFAFRIFANETLCPSAMSIFDWTTVLPEAVRQSGYNCRHVSRLWHEGGREKERRELAHQLMLESINDNTPSVVWDINEREWGLIIGYDDDRMEYITMANRGGILSLPYEKLGRNGIDILSVITPFGPNDRTGDEKKDNSLRAIVAHAEQKEWTDRPAYQNGLAAYDQWALLFDRWAMIVDEGKTDNIKTDIVSNSNYYSSHYASARCYARDYMKMISNGNSQLTKAADAYEIVASLLKAVWKMSPGEKNIPADELQIISKHIWDARRAEEEGVNFIKDYLHGH
jgi:hypothetical protein